MIRRYKLGAYPPPMPVGTPGAIVLDANIEAGGSPRVIAPVSFLMPNTAYDVAWTQLGNRQGLEEAFNDYPAVFDTDGNYLGQSTGTNSSVDSDATFGQSIPIPGTVSTRTALIAGNPNRSFLLFENNSSATAAGDVAPTLYVGFDGPVPLPYNLSLAIPPGSGILLDRRVPMNAIYVVWSGEVNTGNSVVVGGVAWQGMLPLS